MRKLSEFLYDCLKRHRSPFIESIRKKVTRLSRGTPEQTETEVAQYIVGTLKQILIVLFVMLALGILVLIYDFGNQAKGICFERRDYGEDAVSYILEYESRDKKLQTISVTVDSVLYHPEELEDIFQQGFFYLEQNMLGENVSLDKITNNLNLETVIPNSGLTVKWSSDNYERLDEKGVIKNEDLQKPELVCLTLELSYQEKLEIREYQLMIYPKEWTEDEMEQKQIQTAIEEILAEHPYEKEVYLPTDIQGVKLQRKDHLGSRGWLICGFGVTICFLLWFRKKEELNKKIQKQKQELLREYPFLVNQLVLFLGAGTTIRGAFERILSRYEKQNGIDSELFRELTYMWNEMRMGVPQEQAYLNMGKRIGLLPYMKLTTLLVQQIRTGSRALAEELEQEEHSAFEQRKEQAKKMGEEAGTKLLFPMIILMLISMIIVVCPALLQMISN